MGDLLIGESYSSNHQKIKEIRDTFISLLTLLIDSIDSKDIDEIFKDINICDELYDKIKDKLGSMVVNRIDVFGKPTDNGIELNLE